MTKALHQCLTTIHIPRLGCQDLQIPLHGLMFWIMSRVREPDLNACSSSVSQLFPAS